MPDKKQTLESTSGRRHPISRREFALRAALASAATTLAPAALLSAPAAPPAAAPQEPASAPKLSPESQSEAEVRAQAVLARYGSRLSAEQKADILRLSLLLQPPLDSLRTYPLANGDSPALYLKPLVEREKRPAPSTRPSTERPRSGRPLAPKSGKAS